MRRPHSLKSTPPAAFFAQELPGETPLSRGTAIALLDGARQFFERKLWQVISGDLILVLDVVPGRPPIVASILGQAEELLGVRFSENAPAIDFMKGLMTRPAPDSLLEFVRDRRTLSLDFSPTRELGAPERRFLAAMGQRYPPAFQPSFRAGRPGALDWCVNEEEGQRFLRYLEVVNWIGAHHSNDELAAWDYQHRKELIWLHADGAGGYQVARGGWPEVPAEAPLRWAEAEADAAVAGLLRRQPRVDARAIEIAWYPTGEFSGSDRERPYLLSVAMAADARTGFVFAPEVVELANTSMELALFNVLLNIWESTGGLPREIHMQEDVPAFSRLLTPLGLRLVVKPELPALDEAFGALSSDVLKNL